MAKGTADTSLVKAGHSTVAYTMETLEEFQNCLDPGTGPLYFLENFMKIQHPTKGGIPFKPYDYQLDLIENYNNYRYSINMLGRQMGKTAVAAGYLLWYAMFKSDSTILVAAHVAKAAAEIMNRIRYAYESCPDHIRAGVTEYNKQSISFDNGSRIVSSTTTETTGRGMALTLVYLDEFAFVRPNIAAEFWTSLSPTLATGGKCIVTSTPNSDDDTFANIWSGANNTFDEFGNETDVGINGFKAYMSIWDQHPDRDEAWADGEIGRIGEERFRREHKCEFVIYDETLINSLKLVEIKGIDPVFSQGQVRWYKKPHASGMYILALDPCAGTGGDYSAIQVIDATTLEQVAEWQHNKTPVEGQVKMLMNIMRYIQSCGAEQIYWSVENNGVGEAALVVIRDTGEENFPGDFLTEPKSSSGKARRKGFSTTKRTKNEACIQLKRLVETDKIKLNSKKTISELKNFISYADTYRAKQGQHDDLVMSLILVIRMINFISQYEDTVYDNINSGLKYDGYLDDDFDTPMPIGFL